MNALLQRLQQKKERLLTVYFTAGYPHLNDTVSIIEALNENGADLIEVGMPYSDPLADGPTIQQSGSIALRNGMHLNLLFEQLNTVTSNAPLLLMGYFNQFIQFGEEKFCTEAQKAGVSGVIFPDMPLDIYEKKYADLFTKYDLIPVFLITPRTSAERMQKIVSLSKGFVYAVSSSATTGATKEFTPEQLDYFAQLVEINRQVPVQIGFGISDKKGFDTVCQYVSGAIIGSAFIRALDAENVKGSVKEFIGSFG